MPGFYADVPPLSSYTAEEKEEVEEEEQEEQEETEQVVASPSQGEPSEEPSDSARTPPHPRVVPTVEPDDEYRPLLWPSLPAPADAAQTVVARVGEAHMASQKREPTSRAAPKRAPKALPKTKAKAKAKSGDGRRDEAVGKPCARRAAKAEKAQHGVVRTTSDGSKGEAKAQSSKKAKAKSASSRAAGSAMVIAGAPGFEGVPPPPGSGGAGGPPAALMSLEMGPKIPDLPRCTRCRMEAEPGRGVMTGKLWAPFSAGCATRGRRNCRACRLSRPS